MRDPGNTIECFKLQRKAVTFLKLNGYYCCELVGNSTVNYYYKINLQIDNFMLVGKTVVLFSFIRVLFPLFHIQTQ